MKTIAQEELEATRDSFSPPLEKGERKTRKTFG
jgi:hypothetical protein